MNAVIVRPADQDRVPPGPPSRHRVGLERVGDHARRSEHGRWCIVAREPCGRAGPAPTWQRFGFEWDAAAPGSYEIRARATDSRGWVQPNRGRNAVHAIGVTIVQ